MDKIKDKQPVYGLHGESLEADCTTPEERMGYTDKDLLGK